MCSCSTRSCRPHCQNGGVSLSRGPIERLEKAKSAGSTPYSRRASNLKPVTFTLCNACEAAATRGSERRRGSSSRAKDRAREKQGGKERQIDRAEGGKDRDGGRRRVSGRMKKKKSDKSGTSYSLSPTRQQQRLRQSDIIVSRGQICERPTRERARH